MSCEGCGKDKKYTIYDRHGNVIEKDKPKKEIIDEVQAPSGEPAITKTLYELLAEKEQYKKQIDKQHEDLIAQSTDDMKRIMIMELISIYNHEEISMTRMSPTQALVVLWRYLHHPSFQKVAAEFGRLSEEVDKKYEGLKGTKIKSSWRG